MQSPPLDVLIQILHPFKSSLSHIVDNFELNEIEALFWKTSFKKIVYYRQNLKNQAPLGNQRLGVFLTNFKTSFLWKYKKEPQWKYPQEESNLLSKKSTKASKSSIKRDS